MSGSRDAPCGLGLVVHTGWAACVVVRGTLTAPAVEVRARIELLGDAERFVYHRAAELGSRAGRQLIDQATTAACASARLEIGRIIEGVAPRRVAFGVVVAKTGSVRGSLDEILAAHPRLHAAEGCLFRDALADALRATGIATEVMAPADVEKTSAKRLDVPPAKISELVAAAGRLAGRPWAKDQRLAALAAWAALDA
jgi:hypothetical protein